MSQTALMPTLQFYVYNPAGVVGPLQSQKSLIQQQSEPEVLLHVSSYNSCASTCSAQVLTVDSKAASITNV